MADKASLRSFGEPVLADYPFFTFCKRRTGVIPTIGSEQGAPGDEYWKVTPDPAFGYPGAAAFRLHSLVVVPRIYAGFPTISKVIVLGRTAWLCAELGVSDSGHNMRAVDRALRQLSATEITANIAYRGCDGCTYSLNETFTRYKMLPDRQGVRLELTETYWQLLSRAAPVFNDVGYLLPFRPGVQRFYQLLSPKIQEGLEQRRGADVIYSDYCLRASQTRYLDRMSVQKQMYKLHAPLVESGYLYKTVDYRAIRQSNGLPDWVVAYSPGPAAREEYRRVLEWRGSEQPPPVRQLDH